MVFTLHGPVPSKKNNYRRGANNKMYIPTDVGVELDAFLWQLKSVKNEYRLSEPIQGNISVTLDFLMCKHPDTQDADNMATTVFDLLQKSGLIQNDKYIYEHHVRKSLTADRIPSVVISIERI